MNLTTQNLHLPPPTSTTIKTLHNFPIIHKNTPTPRRDLRPRTALNRRSLTPQTPRAAAAHALPQPPVIRPIRGLLCSAFGPRGVRRKIGNTPDFPGAISVAEFPRERCMRISCHYTARVCDVMRNRCWYSRGGCKLLGMVFFSGNGCRVWIFMCFCLVVDGWCVVI